MFPMVLTFGVIARDCEFPAFESERNDEDGASIFSRFKRCYDKQYAPALEVAHRDTFLMNLKTIHEKNSENMLDGKSMRLGVNRFADLSSTEFTSRYLMRNMTAERQGYGRGGAIGRQTPARQSASAGTGNTTCDRSGRYATPVKDQGSCGSCYVFATVAAAEGSIAFWANESPVALSEQQALMCCDNKKCGGGFPGHVADCLTSHHVVASMDALPYNVSALAAGAQCPFETSSGSFAYERVGFGGGAVTTKYIASGEDAIKTVIGDEQCDYMNAPAVAACIDASHPSFQLYKSGVYEEAACTTKTDHCISIWGWGKSDSGEDFWIIKNSWGDAWGLDGYMHMKRGVSMCALGYYDAYYFDIPA